MGEKGGREREREREREEESISDIHIICAYVKIYDSRIAKLLAEMLTLGCTDVLVTRRSYEIIYV